MHFILIGLILILVGFAMRLPREPRYPPPYRERD
jgi:hypothetical protein